MRLILLAAVAAWVYSKTTGDAIVWRSNRSVRLPFGLVVSAGREWLGDGPPVPPES